MPKSHRLQRQDPHRFVPLETVSGKARGKQKTSHGATKYNHTVIRPQINWHSLSRAGIKHFLENA